MQATLEQRQRLYQDNAQRIAAIVHRMCDDPDMAADVVQDVWVHIFKGLHTFREEAVFSTWATSVAINYTRSKLRVKWRRDKREVELKETSASVEFDTDYLLAAVTEQLPKLPPAHRAVFELDLQGFSHEEIGQKLHITVGSSRTALFRARATLRILLGAA